MKIKEIYSKLHNFVSTATGLDAAKVIFANQNSPRPEKPFVTIELGNFQNIGTPIVRKMQSELKQEIITSMKAECVFTSYADELHLAEELLSFLHSGFYTELQNSIFQGKLALHKTIKNVEAIPVALNEQTESRAILEIELAFNRIKEDNVGIIDTVGIQDNIKNKLYNITKSS